MYYIIQPQTIPHPKKLELVSSQNSNPFLPRETNANSFFISEIFITPSSLLRHHCSFFLSFFHRRRETALCHVQTCFPFFFSFSFSPSLFFSMVQRVNEAESPTLNGWMLARCKTLAFSSPFCSLFSLQPLSLYTTVSLHSFLHCLITVPFWCCSRHVCVFPTDPWKPSMEYRFSQPSFLATMKVLLRKLLCHWIISFSFFLSRFTLHLLKLIPMLI